MRRDAKQSTNPPSTARAAAVDVDTLDDAALVTIVGLVDERFDGFGDLGHARTAVMHVGGITRMTSFGVRQWLLAMEALPRSITDLYLLGCPTFFVDQLNMVLNFGGAAKVLTVVAPYSCPACGAESGEVIDVLGQRAMLEREPPEKACSRCNAKLEFDETPESYFGFVSKHGATTIQPAAAHLLASRGLYMSAEHAAEKAPRIIKLVHGAVTYFRIIGTIGNAFRARPFLVGVEGEVVIDLAEVDRFAPGGQAEWRRLLKTLSEQVPATTLVDLPPSLLQLAGSSLTNAPKLAVASLLAPYTCLECERTSQVSIDVADIAAPGSFEDHVCATCGGTTRNTMPPEALAPLHNASTSMSAASAKVVEHRAELLSRAQTDAKVARAGSNTAMSADDMILGKYKIVRALSSGGMAEVFLAKQVGLDKPVAIKRIQNKLLESRQQAIQLFLNEAKIAGRLMHPNIAQVLDVGEANGALYLAMEYVHGKDLREVLKALKKRGGMIPLPEALYIAREVAQALDYAYWSSDMAGKRLNVVHRDVSPHNVILGYDGTVKLIDFGVAMSAITEHEQSLIVGKWTYMSPETSVNGKADHRSDLFSLGVILYNLCSGAMPFSGPEPKEIIRKIRVGEYRRLEEIAPHVPPRLAHLVTRLLSANPEQRPQRGHEVVAELLEMSRAYGLDSSGSRIAEFLGKVFPRATAPSDAPPRIKELVRVYPDDLADSIMPTQIASAARMSSSMLSITPSARTSRAPLVSETFPRVSETFRRVKEPSVPPLTMSPLSMSSAPRPRGPASPDVVKATLRDTLVNLTIALTILAVVVLGSYLILSNY